MAQGVHARRRTVGYRRPSAPKSLKPMNAASIRIGPGINCPSANPSTNSLGQPAQLIDDLLLHEGEHRKPAAKRE
jgi:hypothetical protein